MSFSYFCGWMVITNLLVFISCWAEESLKEEGNACCQQDSTVF